MTSKYAKPSNSTVVSTVIRLTSGNQILSLFPQVQDIWFLKKLLNTCSQKYVIMTSQKATADSSGLVYLKKIRQVGDKGVPSAPGGWGECGTCRRCLFLLWESWDPDLATLCLAIGRVAAEACWGSRLCL